MVFQAAGELNGNEHLPSRTPDTVSFRTLECSLSARNMISQDIHLGVETDNQPGDLKTLGCVESA